MTITIKNGRVLLNGTLEKKNLLIENGKIAKIGNGSRGETIDAAGKIILPGLIDVHVHLRDPGFTYKEDFLSGTKAAAAGGVTTVLDMPNNKPPITNKELLEEKRNTVKSKAAVNYGFYAAAANNVKEISEMKGIAGVKLYMGATTASAATDKDTIDGHFSSGRTVAVHAEDEEMINRNAEKYKGADDAAVHAKIRSRETEIAAVKEAIGIASGCRNIKLIHFTHTSTSGSLGLIKEAKEKMPISCDATPHHLFLTHEELKKQGNFAKMNPALRGKDDVDAMWRGIEEGIIDCIATDHAPHAREEKEAGYSEAPSGVPGLETMLPLLLDAVNKKRLTLQKLVELTSENPARLYGIKNKGKIAEGTDADIVIVDMKKTREVRNEELLTKCRWSPFAGWKLRGWPVTTIVNGEIVYDNSEIIKGNGEEVEFE